jgi:hypothetical protein
VGRSITMVPCILAYKTGGGLLEALGRVKRKSEKGGSGASSTLVCHYLGSP